MLFLKKVLVLAWFYSRCWEECGDVWMGFNFRCDMVEFLARKGRMLRLVGYAGMCISFLGLG